MHKQTVKLYTEGCFSEWGIKPHPEKHKQSGSALPKEVKGCKSYLFNLYNFVSDIFDPPQTTTLGSVIKMVEEKLEVVRQMF